MKRYEVIIEDSAQIDEPNPGPVVYPKRDRPTFLVLIYFAKS